jgi:hypothetical protein
MHGSSRIAFGELGGRTVGLVGYGAVPKILHPSSRRSAPRALLVALQAER